MNLRGIPVPVAIVVVVGALTVLMLAFVVSTSTLIWIGLLVGIVVGAVIAATSGDGGDRGE